jgi:hypothetical protein
MIALERDAVLILQLKLERAEKQPSYRNVNLLQLVIDRHPHLKAQTKMMVMLCFQITAFRTQTFLPLI